MDTMNLLGGIGLFLLGMQMLTGGLKMYAGNRLKVILLRYISNIWSAMACGFLFTAIVQSSSATILATIGFVSAGLLSFSQSIGVVLGANVGTTVTIWIIAVFGLKFSISTFTMPILFAGAVLSLFAKGRLAGAGTALAGFGVIFVGIDLLQSGMGSYSGMFEALTHESSGSFPIVLILVGIAITVVLQSSSAALVTTLAALHGDVISFEQAALLAIGHNVGTTITAILASIGASTSAKRTAVCQVLSKLFSATLALSFLELYRSASLLGTKLLLHPDDALFALAIFHTLFNVIGTALFLPLVTPLSRLLEKILPERSTLATRFLDPSVAEIPSVGMESLRRALRSVLESAALELERVNEKSHPELESFTEDLSASVTAAAAFSELLNKAALTNEESRSVLSLLHATDHLEQLEKVLGEQSSDALSSSVGVERTLRSKFLKLLTTLSADSEVEAHSSSLDALEALSVEASESRKSSRSDALVKASKNEAGVLSALRASEQARAWDSILYHLWRTAYHLYRADNSEAQRGDDSGVVGSAPTPAGGSEVERVEL